MSKPKIVGPTGATKYLGHFAGERVLRDGHNTDGPLIMKRLRATAHLPRRSDTAEFDDLDAVSRQRTEAAKRAERTMRRRSMELSEKIPQELARDPDAPRPTRHKM